MLAAPISLATTLGISVDFCSSAYLDVSVQQVRSTHPMYSGGSDPHSIGSQLPPTLLASAQWLLRALNVRAKAPARLSRMAFARTHVRAKAN